jgi:hypothetical protein
MKDNTIRLITTAFFIQKKAAEEKAEENEGTKVNPLL